MAFIVKTFWVLVCLIGIGWLVSLGMNGLPVQQKEVVREIELKK